MILSAFKIDEILPHRSPFRFVETVEILSPGISGCCKFHLQDTPPFWSDKRITLKSNELLLLEATAQLFGVVLSSGTDLTTVKDGRHLLLGFDRCTVEKPIHRNLQITIWVELKNTFNAMFKGKFHAHCQDQVIAYGELTVLQG